MAKTGNNEPIITHYAFSVFPLLHGYYPLLPLLPIITCYWQGNLEMLVGKVFCQSLSHPQLHTQGPWIVKKKVNRPASPWSFWQAEAQASLELFDAWANGLQWGTGLQIQEQEAVWSLWGMLVKWTVSRLQVQPEVSASLIVNFFTVHNPKSLCLCWTEWTLNSYNGLYLAQWGLFAGIGEHSLARRTSLSLTSNLIENISTAIYV